MSDSFTIPSKLIERAVRAAVVRHLQGVSLDEVKCLTRAEAAKLLGMTVEGLRKLPADVIDFGERNARYSLASIKKLIESRTVKK